MTTFNPSRNIHYIDFEGGEHYYTLKEFPTSLEKKVKLLNYFRNYMKEHLLKAGANIEVKDGDELSRIPALKTWFRTSRAVVMHLSNGTLQVDFLNLEHWNTKITSFISRSTFSKTTLKSFCAHSWAPSPTSMRRSGTAHSVSTSCRSMVALRISAPGSPTPSRRSTPC